MKKMYLFLTIALCAGNQVFAKTAEEFKQEVSTLQQIWGNLATPETPQELNRSINKLISSALQDFALAIFNREFTQDQIRGLKHALAARLNKAIGMPRLMGKAAEFYNKIMVIYDKLETSDSKIHAAARNKSADLFLKHVLLLLELLELTMSSLVDIQLPIVRAENLSGPESIITETLNKVQNMISSDKLNFPDDAIQGIKNSLQGYSNAQRTGIPLSDSASKVFNLVKDAYKALKGQQVSPSSLAGKDEFRPTVMMSAQEEFLGRLENLLRTQSIVSILPHNDIKTTRSFI